MPTFCHIVGMVTRGARDLPRPVFDSAQPAAMGFTRRDRIVATGGLVLATFIFGANFVGGRQGALAGLSASDLVTIRVAISALLFAPVLLTSSLKNLGGIGWLRGMTLTALGGAPYFFVVVAGLQFAPANHAVVLSPGLTAISGVALSRLILGERPPRRALIGMPPLLAGLVLVAGGGQWIAGSLTWIGDFLLAATGVAYGIFTVLLRRWRVAPVPATAAICLLSAIIWLPGYAVLGNGASLLSASIAEIAGQAILQGVLAGGLAVMLYTRAVAVLGSSRVAIFPVLVPAFGTLLAAAVLGEHLTATQWLGIAVVVGGMVLIVHRGPSAE